jgi:uncharacterized protein (DUF362 family)
LSKVYLCKWQGVDKDALAEAIRWCGGWERVTRGTRVLVKPNLSFPFHKPGATTPPDTIRAMIELLLDRGAQVTVCEGCAGLDAFSMWDAFEAHGVLSLRDEYRITVVELCSEAVTYRTFGTAAAGRKVPVPRILDDTDVFVTMPLVKVHAMTTVSLALKNQWGLIPDKKRLLYHSAIDDILAGVTALVPNPLVVCDARTVLDEQGPVFGRARPAGFLAVGNDIGAFDLAMCRLMGFDPARVSHIQAAIQAGVAPDSVDEIELNTELMQFRPFKFRLRRTLQNYVALVGFRNQWGCRLLYDSVIGTLLHKLLYALKGNPLREAEATQALRAGVTDTGEGWA